MLQFVLSSTHLSHITLSQPFRMKCERYIFLKKCVRSSLLLIMFPHAYAYMYSCICHHHHVVPLARIFLTLSRHFSLSFIASGWSSELHPVSSHSCWMYVRAGCPAFARPYVGVHRSTSLIIRLSNTNSSL